jgi:hypothetical protein
MNSQEELTSCLLQLTDVLARRLSIVRDSNEPCVASAQKRHVERDEDRITALIPGPACSGVRRWLR